MADEGDHVVPVLVAADISERDKPPLRLRTARLRRDDLALEAHSIAGIDRPQPLQLFEAGGRAELRDLSSGRGAFADLPLHFTHVEPHPNGHRVPPRGEQPTEMTLRRRLFVEMKRLR